MTNVLQFKKALDSLSDFIIITGQMGRMYINFTGEKTEARRGTVTCLRSHSKWQKHKNPGFQPQILCSLSTAL